MLESGDPRRNFPGLLRSYLKIGSRNLGPRPYLEHRMTKKNILAIGPVSPGPEDIATIAKTLSFLDEEYTIDYLDPLSIMEDVPNQEYYQLWEQLLASRINKYDVFIGFSFGGVIIQQCFSLFAKTHKAIILFSTPTFADRSLTQKLGAVINLCQEKKLPEALHALYQPVFYPNEIPAQALQLSNPTMACERLIFGLTRVLQTNSTELLQKTTVDHLHLIGEYSDLVNTKNIITPRTGRLVVVPKASMRVLQDNPSFCQKIILETLNNEVK